MEITLFHELVHQDQVLYGKPQAIFTSINYGKQQMRILVNQPAFEIGASVETLFNAGRLHLADKDINDEIIYLLENLKERVRRRGLGWPT